MQWDVFCATYLATKTAILTTANVKLNFTEANIWMLD